MIGKENLYKIESEEFTASRRASKNAKFTPRESVGKLPTSKPDQNHVLGVMRQNNLSQNKLSKLAGVRRQVVNDLLRGRFYKKSPAQEKFILWLFKNGFEDCFPKKEEKHICVCPHCGSRHKIISPIKGE